MSGTLVEVDCCACGGTGTVTPGNSNAVEYFNLDSGIVTAGEVTLSNTPLNERVLLNGLELSKGPTYDYEVVGDKIVFNDPNCFTVGDLLVVNYQFS